MNLSFVRDTLRRTFRLKSSYLPVEPKSENKECKDKVLVVGLGNYCAPRSRHSVGQNLLEHVAERNNCQFEYKRNVKGHLAHFVHNEFEVYLLKPKVFMNLSGKSVIKATRLLKIEPVNVLLLHDELDLPLGKFRVKSGGSANGHNGVRDSQERLKFTDLKRIRIGIGRPPNKDDVADYVLEDFTKPEKLLLRAMYGDLSELLMSTVNLIVNPQDAQPVPKKKNKQPKKKKVKIIEPDSGAKSPDIVNSEATSPDIVATSPDVADSGAMPPESGATSAEPMSANSGATSPEPLSTDVVGSTASTEPEGELTSVTVEPHCEPLNTASDEFIPPENTDITGDPVPQEEPIIVFNSPELADVVLESEEVKISEIVQKDVQVESEIGSVLITESKDVAVVELVVDPEETTLEPHLVEEIFPEPPAPLEKE